MSLFPFDRPGMMVLNWDGPQVPAFPKPLVSEMPRCNKKFTAIAASHQTPPMPVFFIVVRPQAAIAATAQQLPGSNSSSWAVPQDATA